MENNNETNRTNRSTEVQGLDAKAIFNKKQLEGIHTPIEALFDKELYLQAVLFITGGPKGDFAIIQADKHEDGTTITLSNGSHIVLEKLNLLAGGAKCDDFGVHRFPVPYRIKIVKRISGKGAEYHDIEGWE